MCIFLTALLSSVAVAYPLGLYEKLLHYGKLATGSITKLATRYIRHGTAMQVMDRSWR